MQTYRRFLNIFNKLLKSPQRWLGATVALIAGLFLALPAHADEASLILPDLSSVTFLGSI